MSFLLLLYSWFFASLLLFFFLHPLIVFIGISLHNALCDLFLSCYIRYTTIFSQSISLLAVWLHRERKTERINFIKRFLPIRSFIFWKRETSLLWTNVITPTFIYSFRFFSPLSLCCCCLCWLPCVSFALDSCAMEILSGRQFGKSWMPVMISLVTWKINKFSSIDVNTNQFFESKRSNNTKFSHTPKHVFERVRKSSVVVVATIRTKSTKEWNKTKGMIIKRSTKLS